MRPIRLKMQAFGPYIDECEIDLSEFGDRALPHKRQHGRRKDHNL